MRGACVAVLAIVAGLSATARAQTTYTDTDFNPDRFVVTSDPTSIGLTESAGPLERWAMAAGLDLRLGAPPLRVCVQDATGACSIVGDIVTDRVAADASFALGLGRFGVHAQLPMVLHQSSDFEPAMGQSGLAAAGIGDLRLGGKARIVRAGGVTVGADLTFSLPTGQGSFIGDGGTVIEPRALVDWRHGAISLAGSAGYAFRSQSATIATLYVDDEVVWTVGGEYQVIPARLSVGAAILGHIGVMSQPDPMAGVDPAPSAAERFAEVLLSGRYWLNDTLALEAGAGTALDTGYGAPTFRALAGVRWMKRPKVTPAPALPPAEPAPEPAPVADTDKDGLLDDIDRCVNLPEDKDGFEDDDGCPDEDDDKDGITDVADGCPKDPEDVDTFEDDDGCPDPDNDGDGILDAVDNCPLEPEIVNQIDDEDGCPDMIREPVVVTTNAFEINETIYFELNKARIKSRSHKLLDAVAKAIIANPDVRVEIQGHTDDTGAEGWNQELSQARAQAVTDYLISRGVDASRLEAKGYGNSQPKVHGSTEAKRAKNRRVEFVIIQ